MLTSRLVRYPLIRETTSKSRDLSWAVLATYYAFIFSIPFQTAEIGLPSEIGTTARLGGYLFVIASVLKPRLCYTWPDRSLWFFAAYLGVFVWSGIYASANLSVEASYLPALRDDVQTTIQLLILFWITTNLLRHDNRIVRRTLSVFALACLVLSITQYLGVTGGEYATADGRATVFGTNPNALGNLLMLGLLALLGLAYGRAEINRRARFVFWTCSAFLLMSIVNTGSRGALVALAIGFGVFSLKRANLGFKLKLGLTLGCSIGFLIAAIYSNESVLVRWERLLNEGYTSGREVIYPAAVQMVREKPLLGWGPNNQGAELGARIGAGRPVDAHNLYLHVLTQVGLLGSVPFFLGLWFCILSAWRARETIQGILPMAMLLSMLALSAKGTLITDKMLWFVLAYAVASGTYPLVAASRTHRLPSQPFNKYQSVPSTGLLSQSYRFPRFGHSSRGVDRF